MYKIHLILASLYALCIAHAAEPITPLKLPEHLDKNLVTLGQRLFNDTTLSANNNISCSSCHILELAGADLQAKSKGTMGKLASANTPTVFNSAYNSPIFHDGRAIDLAQQVDMVVNNPIEMGSTWPEIVKKIKLISTYQSGFEKAGKDINPENITLAIVEYEKSLVTLNSPFDRFLNGDSDAISEQAKAGYLLFKRMGCIACHQGANVGGNLLSKLGIFKPYHYATKSPDQCIGKECQTGKSKDRGLIRVPSLRLAVFTPPYLHDGSIKTIEELIRIMGRYQLGHDFNDRDIALIKAFLLTLPGEWNGRTFTPIANQH
ncbi:MAG: cytochrome-c peroxidase [bacterium]